MRIEKMALGETNSFSPIFLDYIKQKDALRNFFHLKPELAHFEKQANLKIFPEEKRIKLQQVINQQYEGLQKHPAFTENLKSLIQPDTFTITTGHQLNLFTGPLYFIYKIITIINLAKKLQKQFPDKRFVPVYWMASEDHDFEEINHFRLFNQYFTWLTDQSGAVGRFNTSTISELLEKITEVPENFKRSYSGQDTLANATRYLVNELFGEHGLVVLDADNRVLKSMFRDIMRKDILHQHSNRLVSNTSKELESKNYKSQVFSRDINFFYLDNNIRSRFVQNGDHFEVLDQNLHFDQHKLIELLEKSPDKISPNVITRPLYQEAILPNIAYVGGPAEVAYWLQLREVFEYYQIPFPIIVPRNFALIVNKTNAKKLHKINIKPQDLFLDSQALKDKYILENGKADYQLDSSREKVSQVFAEIKSQTETIDKSLVGFIGSEEKKVDKIISNLEKRLKKAEEKNQETAIKQIEKLKEKLFPEGKLQERVDNFLNFQLNDPQFISFLLEHLDPLDFRFNIIIEDE